MIKIGDWLIGEGKFAESLENHLRQELKLQSQIRYPQICLQKQNITNFLILKDGVKSYSFNDKTERLLFCSQKPFFQQFDLESLVDSSYFYNNLTKFQANIIQKISPFMGASCRNCHSDSDILKQFTPPLTESSQIYHPKQFYSEQTKQIIQKMRKFMLPEIKEEGIIKTREPLFCQDNKKYYGQMLNGKRHGLGKQVWEDFSLYEGYWKNDMANGQGRLIHSDGDVYQGQWKDDKVQGHGVYYYKDGSTYTGEWKNDVQHGYGIESSSDGSIYYGNFANGKKNGFGKFTWTDGSIFEGNLVDNTIEGQGKFQWPNKKIYEGQWKNNKMDGSGKLIWPDGKVYSGYFKDDLRNGFGTLEWEDGKRFEGQWKDDLKNGEGRCRNIHGEWSQGIWKDGKQIQ